MGTDLTVVEGGGGSKDPLKKVMGVVPTNFISHHPLIILMSIIKITCGYMGILVGIGYLYIHKYL